MVLSVPIRVTDPRWLPKYATSGAAAVDLYAAIKDDWALLPDKIYLVTTGIFLMIPNGYQGEIRPRSGLSTKNITIPNSPGTIDSDFRGEIKVLLKNEGKKPYILNPGARIAQMVFMPCVYVKFVETDSLSETKRGAGGFGSTGK